MFAFFFRLASLVLSESLAMVFAWNSSPLQGAVHQPVAFHNFKLFSSSALSSLLNYGFISDTVSFICTCAFKQSWTVNITQYHESVSGRLWSLWCSQSHWASSRVLQHYFIIAQIIISLPKVLLMKHSTFQHCAKVLVAEATWTIPQIRWAWLLQVDNKLCCCQLVTVIMFSCGIH